MLFFFLLILTALIEKWIWNKQVSSHLFWGKMFLTADEWKRGPRPISGCSVALRLKTERPRWPCLWVRLLWEVLPPAPPVEILIQLSSFPATSVESKPSPESNTESSYGYESQWLRSDSRLPCFIGCFWRWKVEMPTWRHTGSKRTHSCGTSPGFLSKIMWWWHQNVLLNH